MNQQPSSLSDQVSSEDWENTPTNVKRLVNSLIANSAISESDCKCNKVEDRLNEAALKESELKLSNLIDAIPGAVYQFQLSAEGEFSIVFMSQGIRDLWGISPEQVMSDIQVIWDLILPRDLESVHRSISVSAQTLERWNLEFRIQTASGKIKWIWGESLPYQQEGGEIIWNGILTDISDRKRREIESQQIEEALNQSETRFRNIAENLPGAIFRYLLRPDNSDAILYMSPGCYELWEVEPEAVLADVAVLWQMIDPEDVSAMYASVMESAQTLQTWCWAWRITTPSGRRKWLEASGSPERQANGDVIWDTLVLDVTDRKRAEAAFRESESRFQTLANNVPGVIFGYCLRPDGSDQYTYISSGFLDLYGFAPDEALQDTSVVFNMTHPDDLELLQNSITESFQTMETWQCQYRIITLSGQIKWIQGVSRPTQQPNGDLIWDGLIIDISDRKFGEERSKEQQTQLDLVVEASQIGFYISDLRTETSIVSPAYKTQLGYAPDAIEASPDDWNNRLHPDDRERAITAFRAFKNSEIYSEDFRLRHRDGSYRWIYSNAQLIRDAAGTPIKVVGTHIDITDRKQAELALAKSEQRFRNLFEATPKISVQGYNQHRQVIYWNDASAEIYGYTKTEAMGRQLEDLIIPSEMRQGVIGAVQNWVTNGEPIPPDELELMHKDGSTVTVYSSHIMLQNSEGEQELYCVDIDLSDRKQAEIALKESEERYRLLAENVNDLVCLHHPDGRYIYVSISCEALLGYCYDEMVGQDPYTFFHPDDRDRIRQEAHEEALSGKPIPITYRMRHKSGYYTWFETLTKPIRDLAGQVIQIQTTSRDVTERIQIQAQLKYDALHDTLTGLPNRNLLMERLELALHRAKRLENYHFAVLFLDLDRFKVINDSLGHLAGDKLLIAIAQKLQVTFREIDLVARLGGDEFVILLEDLKDIQEAIHATERIFTELEIPITIEERDVYTTASLGVVFAAKDYSTASDLLRDADIAMYRAKTNGKARYEIFDGEMHRQALKRMHLENDLRRAIDCQEFVLHYQPIVALDTGYLVGFEALIRWQHPSYGLRYPGDFIAVAEEIGVITSISYWALRTACQQLVTWQTTFPDLPALKVSVNLSSQDLRRCDLVEEIDRILAQTRLPATRLTLEITESMLIDDIESTIVMLTQLKEKGIQISIDDFGTGYSSLSYLHRLPMNNLKVDRSFVNQMQEGKKNHRIVETIATLSQQLELVSIAEGIETSQQLEWLQQLGYKFGQGYLFSKPLSQDVVEELLETTNLYLFPQFNN